MNLIDKDKLRISVRNLPSVDGCSAVGRDELEDVISDALVVDAVEVVRCKDCVSCGFCGDRTNLEIMGFNGFCSRGTRAKEKEEM